MNKGLRVKSKGGSSVTLAGVLGVILSLNSVFPCVVVASATLESWNVGIQQDKVFTLKGIVLNEQGEPLPGVSVRLRQDPSRGGITNIDGRFSIPNIQVGMELEVSYVGYASTVVRVEQQDKELIVRLKPNDELLKEVVVVGYAKKKVAATSASVVKIDAKELSEKPTANIFDAVQGKVAGVQVMTSSGEPSAIASIRLHGKGSISAGSTPLYILDGMPVSAGVIQGMNPNDFQSMQFLKDAAATSIYGARAANGVIYITTKKGSREDKVSVSAHAQYGVSTLANTAYFERFSNTAESFRILEDYRIFSPEKLSELKSKYGMNETEWYKYFYRNAPTYQADVNVSGGRGRSGYYLSAGVFDQKGLREGSAYTKLNTRLSINSELNEYLSLGASASLAYAKSSLNPFGANSLSGGLGPFIAPYYTPYDAEGNELYDRVIETARSMYSPRYYIDKHPSGTQNFVTNLMGRLTIKPFSGFEIRSQVGMVLDNTTSSTLSLPSYAMNKGIGSKGRDYGRGFSFTTNTVAEYLFNIGEGHHFSTLVGQEYNSYDVDGFSASGIGLVDDRLTQLSHVTGDKSIRESQYGYAYLSFFGQFSYDYHSKYFLDLVLRNDASSVFGENKRNGLFWSVGLLWKMKQEQFIRDVEWIDGLDLRLSTGVQGNADIDYYESLALAGNYSQYQGVKGWGLISPGNPDLGWERQRKSTLGVKVDLFSRLHLNLELYHRLTTDMLMDVPYPYTSGLEMNGLFASIKSNAGTYLNRGIDLNVSGDVLKGEDYGITGYLNFNYNNDRILDLFQGRDSWIIPRSGMGYVVGKPVMYVMPIFKDINPDNGEPRWYLPTIIDGEIHPEIENRNEGMVTSIYSDALEQVTGKPRYAPISGGFGIGGHWRGISLEADFSYVMGKYTISNDRLFAENPLKYASQGLAQDRNVLNFWKKPGDDSIYPGLEYQKRYESALVLDTRILEDASFMRLKNLTIGYTFGKNLLDKQSVLSGAKVYISARNLLTLTKYQGPDPEDNGNVSLGTNPNTKQFNVGLELNF